MHDGFDITFREVIPESAMVELVVAELNRLNPERGVHCSVVVTRLDDDDAKFKVLVELSAAEYAPEIHSQAVARDRFDALRQAFAIVRAVQIENTNADAAYGRRGSVHALH